jgi:ParB/RepB/Spo0J family partition protein
MLARGPEGKAPAASALRLASEEKQGKAVSSHRTPKEKREIVNLPLEKIHRHPHNRTIEAVSCMGLAESLKRRGLLAPIRVRTVGEHWNLPVGHVQLIDGERRYVAAGLASWDTIDAELVTISDEAAEAEIAAANGQREQLNEIQMADRLDRLQRPVQDGGAGMTQTAAAAEMGISQSYASLLQSVAQLPECWRAAVITGEIPGSFLRPVTRFASCPEILGILWKDYEQDRNEDEILGILWKDYEQDRNEDVEGHVNDYLNWSSRKAVEQCVNEVLANRTRPLRPDDQCDDADWYRPDFEAESLTPKELAGLQVITVPGKHRPTQRCLNVAAWTELQNRSAGREHSGNGKSKAGKSKPAKAGKPEPTPAEVREATAKQDRELVAIIQRPQGLFELGLRLAMAAQIRDLVVNRKGTEILNTVCHVLEDGTRDSAGGSYLNSRVWRHEAQRLMAAEHPIKGTSPKPLGKYPNADDYGRYTLATLMRSEDSLTTGDRIQYYTAMLLLWPQSDIIECRGRLAPAGELPQVWPAIALDILEALARPLGASVRQTWDAARSPASLQARLWMLAFLTAHRTTRQLARLCAELGVPVSGVDKRGELAERIMVTHAELGLVLPQVLKGGKTAGKK